MSLNGRMVLVTGAAKRIGRSLSLAVAQAGADVVIHYGNSRSDAESAQMEIESLGQKAFLLQADLADGCTISVVNRLSPPCENSLIARRERKGRHLIWMRSIIRRNNQTR